MTRNHVKHLMLASFLFSLSVFISCNKPVKDKIAGVWQIEDIKFDADTSMYDTSELESVVSDQKSVKFELHPDMSLKIVTGSSTIEGTWSYNDKDQGVYVIMANSPDSVLMGTYKDGKLVNLDENPGLTITTIFTKEKDLD